MQTKKRAKPVTFGKKKEATHTPELKKTSHVAEKYTPSSDQNETRIEIETLTTETAVVEKPAEEEPTKDTKEEEAEENESEVGERKEETEEALQTDDEETVEQIEESVEEKDTEEKEEEREQEKERSAFTRDTYEDKSKNGNYFVYFLIVSFVSFVIGLFSMAGIDYLIGTKSFSLPASLTTTAPTATPVPTKAPTATVTPTPETATVDKSRYTMQVLNGSGVRGEAAKVRQSLVEEGFKVSSTGNADKQTYTKTQISVKKTVDNAYVKELQTYLEKSYTVEEPTTVSSTAQTADVVIIIGK